jgi:tetratricopeptide (TPR) repeat protein
MRHVYGPDYINDLPITELARDRVVFPVARPGAPAPAVAANPSSPIEAWQRWNDYGIGLLRKEGSGELRQAEAAFQQVEALGRPDGPVNLARVYLREGRITQEAPTALRRAAAFDPPPPAWSVLWLGAQVSFQNGDFDAAIRDYEQILAGGFAQAVGRGFDFSRDYTLLNDLGRSLYERAKQERGPERALARQELLSQAAARFEAVLAQEPEDVTAHNNQAQLDHELGDAAAADRHASLHERYKPDDNARDLAIAAARRRYPAANHAAEAVVVYDLHRPPTPAVLPPPVAAHGR